MSRPDRQGPMIQEELPMGDRLYPWMTLVANVLLRRTTGDQVRRVIHEVLGRWPTPEDLGNASFDELCNVIMPTGLQTVKAKALRTMSLMYACGAIRTRNDLPKSWVYARESWRIFVDGDPDFEPTDRSLREYLAARRQTSFLGRVGDFCRRDE